MKIQKILIALFVLIGITGFTTKISAEENVESTEVQVVESQTLEESAPVMEHASSEKVEKAATLASVDKTFLKAEHAQANSIDQSLYLSSSNTKLNEAIVIAKAGLDSPDINQTEVDNAKDKLILVMKTLVKKGDTTKLQALYEEAQKVDREKLTEESENRLVTSMEGAKALLDSDEVAENDLVEAEEALRLVLGSLDMMPEVGPVDTSLLKKQILKAEKIHVDDKEEYGRRRFLYALDQARKSLVDETKTQDQINDLVIQLQKAQDELITDVSYVSPSVNDDEKLSDEDIIGKPVVNVTPDVVDKEVLPSTGMGNLGFLVSNSMIFSGFALILKERRSKSINQ